MCMHPTAVTTPLPFHTHCRYNPTTVTTPLPLQSHCRYTPNAVTPPMLLHPHCRLHPDPHAPAPPMDLPFSPPRADVALPSVPRGRYQCVPESTLYLRSLHWSVLLITNIDHWPSVGPREPFCEAWRPDECRPELENPEIVTICVILLFCGTRGRGDSKRAPRRLRLSFRPWRIALCG